MCTTCLPGGASDGSNNDGIETMYLRARAGVCRREGEAAAKGAFAIAPSRRAASAIARRRVLVVHVLARLDAALAREVEDDRVVAVEVVGQARAVDPDVDRLRFSLAGARRHSDSSVHRGVGSVARDATWKQRSVASSS